MKLTKKQCSSIEFGDLKLIKEKTGVSYPTLKKALAGGSVTPIVFNKLKKYFENV